MEGWKGGTPIAIGATMEEWNVEAKAEIPLRREKIGRMEDWKNGRLERWNGGMVERWIGGKMENSKY